MNVVQKLAEREHPVEVSIRPECTPKALKRCIDQGYVHLRFPETRGGTELYVVLDMPETDLTKANFDEGAGSVSLTGNLTLDYVRVKCLATIDLSTMSGKGRLYPLQ